MAVDETAAAEAGRGVIRRTELAEAYLDLGGSLVDLEDYATIGLRIVAVGPSGVGKTNAGLSIAEQLAEQGWVSVLVDPEGEIESMYGQAVDADELARLLRTRERSIVVVAAKDATDFIPYGQAILDAADKHRQPLFVMLDEGQVFSASRKRKNDIGIASDLVNEFAQRGRKRALDLFMTATSFTGSLHRHIFANKNLSLIGCQEDPAAWAALAPQFRASRIEFGDLAALGPGEFYCFTRRGVDKVRMPMAAAMQKVALKAPRVRPALPSTFSQWDRAMREIPHVRLQALTEPVQQLLGAVAGLTPQQMLAGRRALEDELQCR
ncbi:ATP-binding protein [Pseudoxanthomonas sp. USHLN014]|uniref:ATP-binding protein n=1 Tax=Pseudoxanthomonas sp. USHLN014 TaxID=3081297 RepID=UPI00301C69E7